MTSDQNLILQMRGIVKDFPGTRALDDVDFDVRVGEVHGLVGENGAGKSTLMNILAGREADYSGSIVFDGEPTLIKSPLICSKLSKHFTRRITSWLEC